MLQLGCTIYLLEGVILMDPFLLGYYIGEIICDVVIVSTGTGSVVVGYTTLKSIAKAHALADKSAEAISENLFDCLEFLD